MKIWVDDIRRPVGFDAWFLNSIDAIDALKYWKESGTIIELMSLDHDLGGDDTSRPIVLWMILNKFWPEKVICHSANPVGKDWIEGMIDRYKPSLKSDIPVCRCPAGPHVCGLPEWLERYKS